MTRKKGSGWKRETESTCLLGYFQETCDCTRPILFSATKKDQKKRRKRQLTMTITATMQLAWKLTAIGSHSPKLKLPLVLPLLFPTGDLCSPFVVLCYASNARQPSKYALNFMHDQVAYMNEQCMDFPTWECHRATPPHFGQLEASSKVSIVSEKTKPKAQVLGGW